MTRFILPIFTALLAIMNTVARAQSNDGWFTGKAVIFCASNFDSHNCWGCNCCYYYNFNNEFSLGTALLGLKADNGNLSMPIATTLRHRFLSYRALMPIYSLSAGYSCCNSCHNGLYLDARLGVETGKLSRIRYATEIGAYHLKNGKTHLLLGVGILF